MKIFINIILILFLTFSFDLPTYASSITNYDRPKNISLENPNLILNGSYPIISNLSNKSFEKTLNEKIANLILDKVDKLSQKPNKKIELSYNVIKDDNIISILIYFKNIYTLDTDIYSINIDCETNKYININSILNENGINYANKVVSEKCSSMGIKPIAVDENTPFYCKNNNIYIIFGAGKLTFAQKGNLTFELPKKNLKNYKISEKNYYTKSNYNVKMVPLRNTLEYFGYQTRWDNNTNSITVTKDKTFVSYLNIGQNKYSDTKNKFIRQLEFAPEIKNGITYVPISYFSQILDMLFATDKENNIIISEYYI